MLQLKLTYKFRFIHNICTNFLVLIVEFFSHTVFLPGYQEKSQIWDSLQITVTFGTPMTMRVYTEIKLTNT